MNTTTDRPRHFPVGGIEEHAGYITVYAGTVECSCGWDYTGTLETLWPKYQEHRDAA